MTYAFPPPESVSLAISGERAKFPVRRVYCIGKNYEGHVKEMGGDIARSQPIFFTKAAETLVPSGTDILFPPNTDNLHYEIELVVAIGPDGIFGYAAGIDLTRRDIQSEAKRMGAPWDRAKNFRQSAPCSKITRAENIDIQSAQIILRKNGEIMQSGRISDMIWSIDEIITRLTNDMDLQPGDLIFTGTPKGVGPAIIGDELCGEIQGLEPIIIRVI